MSSFLRESIIIKSTEKTVLEVHINLFLSQKNTKKISFEVGIWVKQIKKEEVDKTTLQIIVPHTKKEDSSDGNDIPEIEDLSEMFQDKDKNFTRLIFNEELIEVGDTFKLNNEKISFQKITSKNFPSIEIQNAKQGDYYRFRIVNIKMDDLITEQQCSSFIGDPIKRSVKIIGFYINNERNSNKQQDIGDKDRVKNVLFNCINTFLVCNMGVDILDSMQEKRSFRVLEDQKVWEKYLARCIDGSEIPKAIVYQFKKENKLKERSEKEEFQDFKLFIRFLETESSQWNILPTISAVITLAFLTNTVSTLMPSSYVAIIFSLVFILTTFFLFWRRKK